MDLKEQKDLLLKYLHIELQLFNDSILQQTKEEIYKSSYKIEMFVNTYEILLEDIAHLDQDTVQGLLYQKFSILNLLYQEWITREDGVMDELKAYIDGELKEIAKINSLAGEKEGKDGTEFNKAT